MSGDKKTIIHRQTSYNPLYVNPLTDLRHNRSCSDGGFRQSKENLTPNTKEKQSDENGVLCDKENANPSNGSCANPKKFGDFKSFSTGKALKPSSLHLCMQMNEPDKIFGSKLWEGTDSEHSSSLKIWDFSDSEAAPASSWSTLPNRSLLCRPLPVDVGRCTCVIVKEKSPDGLRGGAFYSLYTNEGKGRQDRKLAVARHRRQNGRSEYKIAQSARGILCNADDSFVGSMTTNLVGSKYHIWDQASRLKPIPSQSKSLLAAVTFMPTITTWTGSHRSMKAFIPKHQTIQLKNTNQVQHIAGLPREWEEEKTKVHQLVSRVPQYNKISKQYELDFRDRGRAVSGLTIQTSVKNFQLTLEENGKQTILQLGRIGKSKYVMDYRYPLTGYQAFCICLASIDSKLCCSV
ncbi:tubby-like protein 8 isoform X2 [Cucurbita maxima]|uniref:Tubby-like protein 8 isoform X2 n=1 Tax=Cucurbita maxima TaxID=3661 RepID=A0A6J1KVG2_CUCMA|nr:tubby-like protein 8 isoform X2 [Cucurbita maxima]